MPGVNSLQSSLEGMQFTLNRRELDIQNRDSINDQSFDLSFSGIDRTIRDKSLDFNKLQLDNIRVNQYLQSEDYVTGVSGWRINMAPGLGDVEFGSGTFRGTITATAGTIGGFSIGADYIRDAANSMGLASTVTGGDDVRFWAGDTFANRATAPFRVTEAGLLTATGATINGTQLLMETTYGDGADGNATISGTTTLTADIFYNDLTIQSGGILDCAGFRVFVAGTCTIDTGGILRRNGNNGGNGADGIINAGGAGGTAGTAPADGSIKGAVAGQIGGQGGSSSGARGSGVNGSAVVKSLGVLGVGGGGGFDPGAVTTVGSSSGGAKSGTVYNNPRSAMAAYMLYDFLPAGDNLRSSTGSGSGGGGDRSAGTASGGGGGGSGTPGGIVTLFARTLVLNGTIQATGGNGGNGGNGFSQAGNTGGGGGGGAPGSGGVVILIYQSKTGSGSISVAAGTRGTGGTGSQNGTVSSGIGADGAVGSTANTGVIIELTA